MAVAGATSGTSDPVGAGRLAATGRGTILSIQYLRALACLAVVLFHALGGRDGSFTAGQTGVDLFFVISGFIMWSITERRERAPGQFLGRRLLRIVPLYWAITVAISLAIVIGRIVLHRQNPGPLAALHDMVFSLLFIPFVNGNGDPYPVIYQGWTINYEMLFYLLMAACLWLPRPRQLAAVAAVLGGLVAAGLILRPGSLLGDFYTSPMLLEFLFGVALARLLAGRAIGPGLGAAVLAAGFASLAIGIALFGLQPNHGLRVVQVGLPAVLILFGAIGCEPAVPRLGWLKAAGDGSYAIYLVHGSVVALALHVPLPFALRAVIGVAASVAVGMLLHGADTRFRALVSRAPSARPRTALPAAGLPVQDSAG